MLRRSSPLQLHPFAAERLSSEVLAHYFIHRHLPQHQCDTKPNLRDIGAEETLARLDKVEPSTVGRVYIQKLYKQAPAWAKEILVYMLELEAGGKVLEECTEEQQQKKRDSRGAPPQMNLRWLQTVFEELKRIGMMEKFDCNDPELRKFVQAHAHMFMVEKEGKHVEWMGKLVTVLRIITDAREANVRTDMPAPYNLFTLDSLFQCFSNLYHRVEATKARKFYCINVDLRHYFHQLTIPAQLRNFFQLQCGQFVYRMQTLPMGWYLSPSIAQTATWAFLLGREKDGEKLPGIDDATIKKMPQWVPFCSNLGGIFVLQDNILILTEDINLAQKWVDRMNLRSSQDPKYGLNFEFKGEKPKVIEISGDTFTEFNGIDFGYGWWRTADKHKREDLFGNESLGKLKFTHRQIAGMLGEVLWSLRVRGIKSLYRTELMKIFGDNTPEAVEQWDDINNNITQQQLQILKKEVEEARTHPKVHARPAWSWEAKHSYSYAADASLGESDTHAQLAICARTTKGWRWQNRRVRHEYIGDAELECIVWCVKDAVEVSKGQVTTVLVATDSLCAKGWVERMYSDRPSAQRLLMELDHYLSGLMTGKAIRLVCSYVNTKYNIADIPSRTQEVDMEGNVRSGDQGSWSHDTDAQSRLDQTSDVLFTLRAQVVLEGKKLDLRKLDTPSNMVSSGHETTRSESPGSLPDRRQRE